MNDYMRENKIEAVAPTVVTQVAGARTDKADGDGDGGDTAKSDKSADKPAKAGGAKRAKAQDS